MESAPLHLVFGATGQVGFELVRELAAVGRVVGLSRPEVDLERIETVRAAVRTHRPAVIWNAAAATAVDALEDNQAQAFRVNAVAPGVMAEEARRIGAVLVHFSTDYVFDGTKRTPYVEDDQTKPLNVYGQSKAAGESAVRAGGSRFLILRTSWVYSTRGRNFLRSIMERGATQETLDVVDDQIGAPTWSREIARACTWIVRSATWDDTRAGLFHLAAAGSCSWFEYACAIREIALSHEREWHASVRPVPTSGYPARARRPSWSVLDSGRLAAATGYVAPHWRTSLAEAMNSAAADAVP